MVTHSVNIYYTIVPISCCKRVTIFRRGRIPVVLFICVERSGPGAATGKDVEDDGNDDDVRVDYYVCVIIFFQNSTRKSKYTHICIHIEMFYID